MSDVLTEHQRKGPVQGGLAVGKRPIPRALFALSLALIFGSVAHAETPPKAPFPQEPGTHHLALDVTFEGQTETHTYGLYLPPNVNGDEKLPMVVYLVGAGERGNDERQLFMLGPLAEMERHEALKKWVDFAVLVVQCPRGERYESPKMGHVVAETTRHVIEHWPIDPNRVHLTGMSMGGEGVWHAALAGPGLYATVTALAGRAHPDPDAVAEAMKGTTAWLVVGDRDGDFTRGSKQMVETFRDHGVDTVHTVLPGFRHNIWKPLMSKRQYYEFLLLHARGQAAPPNRPGNDKLIEIAYLPPEDEREAQFTAQVTEAFEDWLPYWQIENCGRKGGVGHHERFGKGEDVFLTHPLSPLTPCRLMTTWKLPAGKTSTLKVRVGCHPRGDWRLVIRVDNQVVVDEEIDRDDEAEEIYRSFEVDLSEYAGQEVPIQLYNQATDWGREYAVWDDIEIVSE